MKFAKELGEDLVPEWRVKYLNYKEGKKRVKTVKRLADRITKPRWTPRQNPTQTQQSPAINSPCNAAVPQGTESRGTDDTEEQPLRANGERSLGTPNAAAYGSIHTTPATRPSEHGAPSFTLPDPAISPANGFTRSTQDLVVKTSGADLRRASSEDGDAYQVGRTHTPMKANSSLLSTRGGIFRPQRTLSTPYGEPRPSPLTRRMFSFGLGAPQHSPDVSLKDSNELQRRQDEFKNFLNNELFKIEEFYKEKEEAAENRLLILKDQLWILRYGLVDAQRSNSHGTEREEAASTRNDHQLPSTVDSLHWLHPIQSVISSSQHRLRNTTSRKEPAVEPDSESLPHSHDQRDFARRPLKALKPDRDAARQLKLALKEYYRGLELLRSYTLLNRTAFRKINKKYDKAVAGRLEPLGYMTSHVNKSHFAASDRLESLVAEVEKLYGEYLITGKDKEGNHKIAMRKLRTRAQAHDYNGSVFRSAVFLTAGTIFGVEAIFRSDSLLNHPTDAAVRVDASYLLQLYAGYFLALFLVLLFVLVCRVWSRNRINYVFIFEFDSRHNLDWRQLAEIPALFWLFMGLSMWLNFTQTPPGDLFRLWPAILVAATLLYLIIPLPILYHRSRLWFLYSNFRLLLAGIYSVEFRDFFLGDMLCSLTYAMGNIEVFFCLYATNWSNPTQCNSSHSRLLGFFSTLPAIWRALQCLRRYRDTKNVFPHLVNCGKYSATILFYATLSAYRINQSVWMLALFITFASINSVYVSVWDLVMDWSLLNPYAKYPFLRNVLGYDRIWPYYLAMVIDPLLRFNWVFYVIFRGGELQHSALLSFFIAFSEIMRRGMWTIFRVENEHCTNVGHFRASRDIPLPFPSDTPTVSMDEERVETSSPVTLGSPPHLDGAGLERAPTTQSRPSAMTLRHRHTMPTPTLSGSPITRGLNRVGTLMASAHAQDFERKKRPTTGVSFGDSVSSDEDSEEDEPEQGREDIGEARQILGRNRSAIALGDHN